MSNRDEEILFSGMMAGLFMSQDVIKAETVTDEDGQPTNQQVLWVPQIPMLPRFRMTIEVEE